MNADRNLLFGILALQMDCITRDALVAAMNAWVLDKSKSLGKILVDHGALAADADDGLSSLRIVLRDFHRRADERQRAAVVRSSLLDVRPLRPDALVLRLRPVQLAFSPADFIQHVVGRAAETVDAVDAGHASHLLLIGFLSLPPPSPAANTFLHRPTHGNSLAVEGGHQDFSLLIRGRRLLLRLKLLHMLGHRLAHLFGGANADVHSQQVFQGATGLAISLPHAQPLEPILQDIGEVARRQAESHVERSVLALLGALGIHASQDRDLAEDRRIASRFRRLLPRQNLFLVLDGGASSRPPTRPRRPTAARERFPARRKTKPAPRNE